MSLDQIQSAAQSRDGRNREMLQRFHDRLVGEATGRLDLVLKDLSTDFELVRIAPDGRSSVTSRAQFETLVAGFFAQGLRTWIEWGALATDGDHVVGFGRVYARGESSSEAPTSRYVGLDIEFRGSVLAREVLHELS